MQNITVHITNKITMLMFKQYKNNNLLFLFLVNLIDRVHFRTVGKQVEWTDRTWTDRYLVHRASEVFNKIKNVSALYISCVVWTYICLIFD